MRSSGSVSRRKLLFGAGALGAAAAVGVTMRPAAAEQPATTATAAAASTAATTGAFAHPGLLHTEADFTRIRARIASDDGIVMAGWQRLTANGRSRASWTPRPLKTVIRGGTGQNYAQFYPDVHAAYQNALRWRITGDPAHGQTASTILNAWSSTLTEVTGNADRFLAAGLYGYQLANAAELLREYDGFDLPGMQNLLRNTFYPLNDDFLKNHNGACISNYWANWDLCTLASVMSIGILCDDRTLFDRAITYLKSGPGNGSIPHAIPFLHGGLGQWQESGRDQGHTMMGMGLLGTICETAWNQGTDLYGFDNNRFLKAAEYVAQYNLGQQVPYTTYQWGSGTNGALKTQTAIASGSRGQKRPVWELILNHYVNRRGLTAPNVTAIAKTVRAEGGGGDYGQDSGGYDQLGFGTLMFTRDRSDTNPSPTVSASATSSATAAPTASATPTTVLTPTAAATPTSSASPTHSARPHRRHHPHSWDHTS